MGSCTAGGAYVPAMSDEIDHRQEPGHDLPRRPAAGEGRDRRGGDAPRSWAAPTCTRRISGVADHYAQNDAHALGDRAAHRRPISTAPKQSPLEIARAARAAYDPAETLRHHPDRHRASPSTCARSSPASSTAREFDEFKARYGTTLVSGFAHIYGYPVGIIANNGILFSESALKGAHFIELCCQRGIPLVFLQNITGFMVGRKYEAGGIAKDGAKMVTAVAMRARCRSSP